MVRRHVAGLKMHLGGTPIIAGDEAMQDFREEQTLLGAEPAHDAEIDGDQLAVVINKEISRMHVGVKEAVAQRMAEKGLNQRPGELPQVEAFGQQPRPVRQRRRIDPFQRQHLLGGAVPVHTGDAKIRIVFGVLGHFRERRGLQAKVHLDRDRAPQGVDHFDETKPPRLGGNAFSVTRHVVEGAQVGIKAAFDTRPQQFDRDRPRAVFAGDFRPMHLRDRGRSDRRTKARKNCTDGLAERRGDRRLRLRLWKRRHVVLQLLQIARRRGADHVGPRRQKLAQLHIARA